MDIKNSYNKDSRFHAIKQKLQSEFSKQGFSLKDKFSSSVWFLAKDFELQKYVTDIRGNEINIIQYFSKNLILLAILRIHTKLTGNQKKEMNHSADDLIAILQNFRFYVCDFIFNFTEILLHYQSLLEESRETINKHAIETAVIAIKEELDKLENEEIEISSSLKSSISFSVSRLENFPKGQFNFKLVLVEHDSQNNLIQYERSFQSGKKLKLNDKTDSLDLTSLNLNSNDVSFPQLFVHSINQEKLQLKILKKDAMFLQIQLKETEDSFTYEERSSKRSKSKSIYSMDHYEDLRSLNSESTGTEVAKISSDTLNSTDSIQFLPNTAHSYTQIQFNYEENSGTNLYSYGISIQKEGEVFGESHDLFIDLFVEIIPQLIASQSNSVSVELSTHIACKNYLVMADFDKQRLPTVVLNVHFEYSTSLKKCLLRRIYSLYTRIVDTNLQYKKQIDSSLSSSFPISCQSLKKILSPQFHEEVDGCCNLPFCSIF